MQIIGMEGIRAQRGLMSQIASGLGLTRAAIVKWDRVPAERVIDVERITGIPRQQLRPDLYASDEGGAAQAPQGAAE